MVSDIDPEFEALFRRISSPESRSAADLLFAVAMPVLDSSLAALSHEELASLTLV
jgi:hypothetical protein